ncbi:MAG TPA: twin-arginine translocase subunit TatC, partial [Phototrophicaceae bacterium]|nr:twin-arginine translocase subunit TatC [Phototrophicaceae bacterium]
MARRTKRPRDPEGRMRLVEHLRELRRRVLLAIIGLGVMAVPAWFLYDPVFAALQAPIRAIDDAGLTAALNFTSPAAAFDMRV